MPFRLKAYAQAADYLNLNSEVDLRNSGVSVWVWVWVWVNSTSDGCSNDADFFVRV